MLRSLYIPRVQSGSEKLKDFIQDTFNRLDLAKVGDINFVSKVDKSDKLYYMAFITINEWYETSAAKKFIQDVNNSSNSGGKRLYYNDSSSYWIILPNKSLHLDNPELGVAPKISPAKELLSISEEHSKFLFQQLKLTQNLLNDIIPHISSPDILAKFNQFQNDFDNANKLFTDNQVIDVKNITGWSDSQTLQYVTNANSIGKNPCILVRKLDDDDSVKSPVENAELLMRFGCLPLSPSPSLSEIVVHSSSDEDSNKI